MNTLNFNDADLKANREGYLSDAQNKRLDTEADQIQRESKYALWVSIGVFAVVTVMIGAFAGTQQDPALSRLSGFIFAGIATIFIFAFVLIVLQYGWSTNKIVNTPLHTAEGTAEVMDVYLKSQCIYRLILRRKWYSWGVTFDFDDESSRNYFERGRRYRVYYLDKHYLLSAEEIEPEKAKR